jgi:hypothetical protein
VPSFNLSNTQPVKKLFAGQDGKPHSVSDLIRSYGAFQFGRKPLEVVQGQRRFRLTTPPPLQADQVGMPLSLPPPPPLPPSLVAEFWGRAPPSPFPAPPPPPAPHTHTPSPLPPPPRVRSARRLDVGLLLSHLCFPVRCQTGDAIAKSLNESFSHVLHLEGEFDTKIVPM